MGTLAKRLRYGPLGQVIATVLGAFIWGVLFAILGMITQQPAKGAVAGTAVGAIIGIGFARGQVGRLVPCMSGFAFLGAILGPGCDADALSSGLGGAAIGALLGAAGLRGFFAMIGGLIGVNVGVAGGGVGLLIGVVAGAWLGWYVAHCLTKSKNDEEHGVLSGEKTD